MLPAQSRTSVDSIKKPSVSAPPIPAPPPPPQSSLLFPILGGGLVLVLVLTGLVYYMANSSSPAPDTQKSPQATARIEPPVSEHIADKQVADDERAQREAALAKEREQLAQDQRRMEGKQRQAEAQQAKETAERKQLEAQRATSSRERELAAQRAREEEQKRQRDIQVASASPDQRFRSLLERFREAYENHDLATIQSISRMSEDRLRNVQVMFANYETIRASIKDVTPTEQGISATLFLDSVTTAGGDSVSLSPLARKFNLRILRQGAEAEKIIW